jgi:hypothetical protein
VAGEPREHLDSHVGLLEGAVSKEVDFSDEEHFPLGHAGPKPNRDWPADSISEQRVDGSGARNLAPNDGRVVDPGGVDDDGIAKRSQDRSHLETE